MQSLNSSRSVFPASKPGKGGGSGRAWPAVMPTKNTIIKSPVKRPPSSLPPPSLSSARQGEYQNVDGMSLPPYPTSNFQNHSVAATMISTKKRSNGFKVSWFHGGFMVACFNIHTCVFKYRYLYLPTYLFIPHLSCMIYHVAQLFQRFVYMRTEACKQKTAPRPQLAICHDSRNSAPGFASTFSLLPFHQWLTSKGNHVYLCHMACSQRKLSQ